MWDFEKDSDKTCFDHRGDYIPESIANEAKKNSEDEDILKRKSMKKSGNGQNNYFIWNSLFSRFQTKL